MSKISAFIKRNRFRIILNLLIFLFLVVLFWNAVFVTIPSGHRGVYWSRFFGGTKEWMLGEGTRYKLPWDTIILYDARMQNLQKATDMLTKDGLKVSVRWVVRYRPSIERLPELNKNVGHDYIDVLVTPVVVSALRSVLGDMRAEEIYTADEHVILESLQTFLSGKLNALPIKIHDVLIMELTLPEELASGIISVQLAEQRLLTYKYLLPTAEKEAERKTIEAQGVRSFQKISGISILKWRGIDATVELSKSPNSKIVIMGTEAKTLPLLLNADK